MHHYNLTQIQQLSNLFNWYCRQGNICPDFIFKPFIPIASGQFLSRNTTNMGIQNIKMSDVSICIQFNIFHLKSEETFSSQRNLITELDSFNGLTLKKIADWIYLTWRSRLLFSWASCLVLRGPSSSSSSTSSSST